MQCQRGLTQYVEVLQRRATGRQLLYVWVAHRAIGSEEELAQTRQAASEMLETASAALESGTPAEVQLLQHPDKPQTKRTY